MKVLMVLVLSFVLVGNVFAADQVTKVSATEINITKQLTQKVSLSQLKIRIDQIDKQIKQMQDGRFELQAILDQGIQLGVSADEVKAVPAKVVK